MKSVILIKIKERKFQLILCLAAGRVVLEALCLENMQKTFRMANLFS